MSRGLHGVRPAPTIKRVAASAIRDNERGKASKMGKSDDGNAVYDTEVVAPATHGPVSGRLLTRGQVARRLGMSLSSVRRMEGEQLKPIVDARGVHHFEETEIQAVFVRVRRARAPHDERADGALAAAAFALFRSGADVIAVVKELREAPERIEPLFGQWNRFRGSVLLNAKSLAAIANALNADALGDEHAVLAAVAAFKKDAEPTCILCGRERGFWCRTCAQEAGRAEAAERESRKLF
jgi:hypothetical protein